jgi:hypothetical protein
MLERAVGAASNGWLVTAARIMLEGRLGEKVELMGPGGKVSQTSGRAFNCTREEATGMQWSKVQLFPAGR